jgi:hypothetical protein
VQFWEGDFSGDRGAPLLPVVKRQAIFSEIHPFGRKSMMKPEAIPLLTFQSNKNIIEPSVSFISVTIKDIARE